MTCSTCETDLPGSTGFCPRCGSPGTSGVPETQAMTLDPTTAGHRATAQPAGPRVGDAPTSVLTADAPTSSAPAGDRVAPAARAARDGARRWADRFEAAPLEVRVAAVGAVITVLSFLLLPYADGLGQPVELAGRLWWRPITAIAATILLASTLRRPRARTPQATDEVPRHTDALIAAVAVAAAGVTEAGLLGLVTGDIVRPRVGFYGMLLGLVLVVVAAIRAARRRLR